MKPNHYARLFFFTDGFVYPVVRLCKDMDEANALCAATPGCSVIDENALGVWVASDEGDRLPKELLADLEDYDPDNESPVGMVFSNPHLTLMCCSMNKVFVVEEIDAGDPEKQRARRLRERLVLISNLPDGRGVYAKQYAGFTTKRDAIKNLIWAD